MDFIFSLDVALFTFINHLPHPAWADTLALVLSGNGWMIIFWALLAGMVFAREEIKDRLFFIWSGGTVLVSWILSELVLKTLFHRIRPTMEIGARIVGTPAEWYSFPSSHATVAFAVAVLLSRYEPRGNVLFFLMACAISLSRVYLGVHYPIDIIAGATLGWVMGTCAVTWIDRRLKNQRATRRKPHKKTRRY